MTIRPFIGDSIIASETDSDDENWYDFIKRNLIRKKSVKFIGIALSESAYKLDDVNNFIRINDYEGSPDVLRMRLFIAIAHQIYRYGLENKPLKIFLSHTKADRLGVTLAKKIKGAVARINNV